MAKHMTQEEFKEALERIELEDKEKEVLLGKVHRPSQGTMNLQLGHAEMTCWGVRIPKEDRCPKS